MTETRAEKAQRLVNEGKVESIIHSDLCTNALVKRDKTHYVTTIYANGTFWCTCKWGDVHSYTDDLCAHALAVKLAVEKENKPC